MPQNIRDVMTSNPCTIDAEKSVAYAAKMMQKEDVGLAPIVEGDKLVGMLTDRDIATRVAAEGRDPDQVKVRDVASKQLITIDPQQDLSEALRKMAKHQVRRLPVVQEDGRLVGVVAQADIAREGDDETTGRLVEKISESGGQMSSTEEGQFPTQFPRPVDDQPESFIGQEPKVEEQQHEENVSKVQAASSRGRRKRASSARKKSSGARKTAARKSTGTRKRKTASRKRSTAKRSTAKRSTAKRSTARRSTAGRKRKTAARKSTGTRKRKTAARKTAGRKAAATRKRKTATRKTAGRKAAGTRKRKTTSRKRSTAKRSTAKRSTAKRSTTKRRSTSRKRATSVRTAGRKGGRAAARRRTTRKTR
jgi:CBS domain-containing protein